MPITWYIQVGHREVSSLKKKKIAAAPIFVQTESTDPTPGKQTKHTASKLSGTNSRCYPQKMF